MLAAARRPGLSPEELHSIACPSFEDLRASAGNGYGTLMAAHDVCEDIARHYRKAASGLSGSEAQDAESKAKFFYNESVALESASTISPNPDQEALNQQVWERYRSHHYWFAQTVFKTNGDIKNAQQQLLKYNGPKPSR